MRGVKFANFKDCDIMLDEVNVDKKYRITLVDKKQVPEFLEKIHSCLEKDTDEEEFGADWFLSHFIHGIPANGVGEKLNRKNGKDYSTSLYLDKFKRYYSKSHLGEAAILALKNEYYPEAIFLTGYGNADLKLGEKRVEVKLRLRGSKQHLEDMLGRHVRDFLENKEPVELVVIYFGVMKCVIEMYSVECV